MGRRVAIGTASTRCTFQSGIRSVKRCFEGAASPHGSAASGSTTIKSPPRPIHSRRARAGSPVSDPGLSCVHINAENCESPSQRSGKSSGRIPRAIFVISFMEGMRSFPGAGMEYESNPMRPLPKTPKMSSFKSTATVGFTLKAGEIRAEPSSRVRRPSVCAHTRTV